MKYSTAHLQCLSKNIASFQYIEFLQVASYKDFLDYKMIFKVAIFSTSTVFDSDLNLNNCPEFQLLEELLQGEVFVAGLALT